MKIKGLYIISVLMCLLGLPLLAGAETLTWTANSETDLAGYKVYKSTTAGVYGAPIATLGKVTSYSLTLTPASVDKTYFFVITAYDLAGHESGKSNEVNKLIPAIPVVIKPGTPVLVVSAKTTTSLTVTYAPVPDGIGGIAKVGIRIAPTPISWGSAPQQSCLSSPCVITGLTPNTSYDLQAVAYRGTPGVDAVFGPLSAVTTVKTLPLDLPPAVPGGLIISKVTINEVVIVASASNCKSVSTSTIGSTLAEARRTVTCNR